MQNGNEATQEQLDRLSEFFDIGRLNNSFAERREDLTDLIEASWVFESGGPGQYFYMLTVAGALQLDTSATKQGIEKVTV